jgi:hypothetical protein
MATDILTFVVDKDGENVAGRLLERQADVTFSASYPTGGYTFPVSLATQYGQLGIRTLKGVVLLATNTAGLLYSIAWDKEAGKLALLTAGAQATGDVSTITLTLKFIGSR